MSIAANKTRRSATGFKAINVGAQKRVADASSGTSGDFQNAPASITRIDKGSFSLPSPGTIAAGATVEVSVTLPDLAYNLNVDGNVQTDIVHINVPANLETGINVGSVRVTAANTLTMRITNSTGSGIAPATNTYLWSSLRS